MRASRTFSRFQKKMIDVSIIMEFHSKVTGINRGRREEKYSVLHKSGIVLLVAAWETYIEELLKDSAVFIVNESLSSNAAVPLDIGGTILANLESKLKNFNTPTQIICLMNFVH